MKNCHFLRSASQNKLSTKSKIFNKIFQFFGYLSFAGAVYRFLKAKILYLQLSRTLEMHVQGTLEINSIKQCLILENNLFFCEFLFYLLIQLRILCIDLTHRSNTFLAKLLRHLLRSQSPYLKKLFFVYFAAYRLFQLHSICANFVLL